MSYKDCSIKFFSWTKEASLSPKGYLLWHLVLFFDNQKLLNGCRQFRCSFQWLNDVILYVGFRVPRCLFRPANLDSWLHLTRPNYQANYVSFILVRDIESGGGREGRGLRGGLREGGGWERGGQTERYGFQCCERRTPRRYTTRELLEFPWIFLKNAKRYKQLPCSTCSKQSGPMWFHSLFLSASAPSESVYFLCSLRTSTSLLSRWLWIECWRWFDGRRWPRCPGMRTYFDMLLFWWMMNNRHWHCMVQTSKTDHFGCAQ